MTNDIPRLPGSPVAPPLASARLTREEAEGLLADWQASGLSLVGYARKRGIDVKQLYEWRRRFRSRPTKNMRLAEVSISTHAACEYGVVITAPNGVRLEMSPRWPVESIAALCKALTC